MVRTKIEKSKMQVKVMNSLLDEHKVLLIGGTPIHAKLKNVDQSTLYKRTNFFTKQLRKIHFHLPLNQRAIWYGEWTWSIKKYDTVILFDDAWDAGLIRYIHKKNPQARIIVYYINKVKCGYKTDPSQLHGLPCEFWSFDKADCKTWQMKFNHLFYDSVVPIMQERLRYDAFFIGVDKGRLQTLLELKKTLDNLQYKTNFIIVKDKRKRYSSSESELLTECNIPYQDVITMIQQSRCIIDIPAVDQVGLTWRPMEAITYNKKLITASSDIKKYDFYCRENIFILGEDDEMRLKEFMTTPYQVVSDEIKWQYTPEAWLQRFFKNDARGENKC